MTLPPTWSRVRPMAARCTAPAARAAFSTTTLSRSYVPPEASSYIRLPEVPQSSEVKPPRIRGTLPVPREVFPRTEGDRKVRPGYVEKTAPVRTRKRALLDEAQRWKKLVAESRRTNLREGLQGLWKRRQESDARRAEAERCERVRSERARLAPDHRSERMTRGTIHHSSVDTALHPDPERFVRAEKSKAVVAARQAARQDARRDALTELYVNATDFIVTEDQLNAEVDKIFADDYFKRLNVSLGRPGNTENVWGAYGKPTTIGNMFERQGRASSSEGATEIDHAASRTKKVSEELTGGKMFPETGVAQRNIDRNAQ